MAELGVGVDGCSGEGLVDADMASRRHGKLCPIETDKGSRRAKSGRKIFLRICVRRTYRVFFWSAYHYLPGRQQQRPCLGRTVAGGPLSLFAGTHPVLPHHVDVPTQHGARDGRHYEGLG